MVHVRRFLVLLSVGSVLFVVGVYMVLPGWPARYAYTGVVPTGDYAYVISFTIYSAGRIAGDFSEASGHPVSLYVFDKQQYSAFQTQVGIPKALFSITEVPSGSYLTRVSVPGEYYVVVDHGVGYGQTSQQVNITLIIDGTNALFQGVGLAAIAAGAVFWAAGYDFRRKDHLHPWSVAD